MPTDLPAAVAAVRRAVEAGDVPRTRVDEAVRRTLGLKQRLGVLDGPAGGGLPASLTSLASPGRLATSRRIAAASLTVLATGTRSTSVRTGWRSSARSSSAVLVSMPPVFALLRSASFSAIHVIGESTGFDMDVNAACEGRRAGRAGSAAPWPPPTSAAGSGTRRVRNPRRRCTQSRYPVCGSGSGTLCGKPAASSASAAIVVR